MVWIKVDDRFDEHPKFVAAGPLGVALWLTGMAYCNRNLTDGFIPWGKARALIAWEYLGPDGPVEVRTGAGPVASGSVIDHLVHVGLWETVEGGYQVHDYLAYQPSKADVLADRAVDAERKRQKRASGRSPLRTPGGTPGGVPGTGRGDSGAGERERDVAPAPAREGADLQLLAEELTGQPYVLANLHSKLGEHALRQARVHGLDKTVRAWRAAAEASTSQPPTIGQVILGAGSRLDAIPRLAPEEPEPETPEARRARLREGMDPETLALADEAEAREAARRVRADEDRREQRAAMAEAQQRAMDEWEAKKAERRAN